MSQPPSVVGADVAAAPFATIHLAAPAGERGVAQPVVAGAPDRGRIAPVVVGTAIGSEVDRTAARLAGSDQVVGGEALPGVARRRGAKSAADHRLDAVAEVLQHLAHAALVAETHDHKAAGAGEAADGR